MARRLYDLNIYTVHDFICADPKYLRRLFNVNIERTWQELNGIKSLAFDDDVQAPKTIYRTRSFGQRVYAQHELNKALSVHVARAAGKAREHQLLVSSMLIFIQTGKHASKPYYRQALSRLNTPTQDTRKLLHTARHLLSDIYVSGYAYAKVGVGLIELIDAQHYQTDLFSPSDDVRSQQLMQVLDAAQLKGLPVGFAQHYIKAQRWAMQRNFKSPKYTTHWNQLPIVQA